MARPGSKHTTELELEILKILWRDGALPVSGVRETLSGFRKLAHTSVMTIMGIMTDKKYLSRKKSGGRYIYRPRISRESTLRGMLGDMVERVFEGSASAAMLNLLETSELDAEELRALRKIVNAKSRGQQ